MDTCLGFVDHSSGEISPDFRTDWNGLLPSRRYSGCNGSGGIQIPEIRVHVTEAEEEFLIRNVNPLGPSENWALIYT